MKFCIVCRIEKNDNEFSKHIKTKDGLNIRCKKCQKEYQIFINYGINLEEEKIKQNNKCACCGNVLLESGTDRQYEGYVDHDHVTNQFRAIICHYCNSMLGHAKDDPDRIVKTIAYMSRTRNKIKQGSSLSEKNKRILLSLVKHRKR